MIKTLNKRGIYFFKDVYELSTKIPNVDVTHPKAKIYM